MSNGKTHEDGRLALYKKLGAGDKVALRLVIIYQSMKKTDKEDALKLARMVMEGRNSRLNQLYALFVHQGITTVVRKDLSTEERRKA